ncbi:DNA polymerase III subunit beta [Candidatus Kuenenbacteria bacterium CG11_big_fil_rev_8_21_14_0_20_37_9]|uniref:Beta sliding clamp n=1 Tax=Candidatus Kuenenbacteria bacterium CG08_land_8_20_14_0_20_37_23 TaxID=1974617 RepID=A0A2M6XTK6_9BACT|nr:MAG: DNA polymerase III subunit beta [Candidatus Kuenenbacteria bacterium CG11_big_fil_rev_8_21_14_0_20_37_9]PIU10975.1 MAG: DNA polymerase III subunit beta [Candidatus Kuenenbacteria bacterium CG08_land_8_20_14_0_20_37_23]
MKVICTQENLKKGLWIVSNIAGKNVSLPILNNILIRAENGMLVFISTNLEIGIKTIVRGKIEKTGSLAVQARLLNDYVGLLDNKNLELIKKENNLLIKNESQETIIIGQEADEYPIIPEIEDKEGVMIKNKELKEALSQVVFSASYNDTRPELSGVLFIFDGETIRFVATDSYRLAEKVIKLPQKNKKDVIFKIIPLRVLQEIMRILEEEGETKIYFSENQVVFRKAETVIISRLIEGNYPDYKQIIPETYLTKAEVERMEFIKLIKTASLFSRAGINDVLLEFDKTGKINISAANTQSGENKSIINTDIKGEKNSIVFNYKYLLDGLLNISSKRVFIEVTSADTPAILRPSQDDSYLYLIMPIRR